MVWGETKRKIMIRVTARSHKTQNSVAKLIQQKSLVEQILSFLCRLLLPHVILNESNWALWHFLIKTHSFSFLIPWSTPNCSSNCWSYNFMRTSCDLENKHLFLFLFFRSIKNQVLSIQLMTLGFFTQNTTRIPIPKHKT